MRNKISLLTLSIAVFSANLVRADGRDYALEQTAIRQAAAAVADSVVQIHTVGGFERIGETMTSQGPATGLIITPDGYIVSSAFNFAQRPSSILVGMPSGKQVPAELVARDLNRMLVLLKVAVDEQLPVPTFVPEREMAVGQWSLALGRTFQTDKVDTSLGIISALQRMHGRVVQTDANVSAANYGGPLVDIRGRVLGILVPMSPQPTGGGAESEVAGAEFYDSGIGFAVPLEHVLTVLDRWKAGEDLLPGKLGIGMKAGSAFVEPPAIVTVWPGSPAAEADWQAGDTIIAVDGKSVTTQSQLQYQTKPLYAGDKLTVSLRRGTGDKAEEFDSEITLAAELPAFRHAFLGILPATPDEKQPDKEITAPGVVVGHVWPESPAASAGIRAGDRLTKLGDTQIANLAAAIVVMKALQPEEKITIVVVRDEKELKLTAELTTVTEVILSSIDLGNEEKVASSEPRELETLKLPQFPQEAKFLAPEKESAAPGLLIWLAEKGEKDEAALAKAWQASCDAEGMVLLLARPGGENGWEFEDLEYLDQLARTARGRFDADPQQTVIAGSGKAGQLAYALGLRRAEDFSGVIADNAPLPRTMKIPENSPGAALSLLTILPANSSFAPLVKQDIAQLRKAGFPVSVLERPAATDDNQQLDATTRAAITRWIAGLNRL
ncbi:MAG: PDZ domain-containing protein [Bythopirellula sp.]|nr:PDZ domain-containing protein [Bythopirellula sp.]